MLGYDITWAAFNIIEVMSSTKFTYKVNCPLTLPPFPALCIPATHLFSAPIYMYMYAHSLSLSLSFSALATWQLPSASTMIWM